MDVNETLIGGLPKSFLQREGLNKEAIEWYLQGNYPRTAEEASIIYRYNQALASRRYVLKLEQPAFTDDYQRALKDRRTITGPVVIALDPVTEGILSIGDALGERVVRAANSGFLLLDSKYDLLAANGIVPYSYMFMETPFMRFLKSVSGTDEVTLAHSRSYIAKKQRDVLEIQSGKIKVSHYYVGGDKMVRVSAGADLDTVAKIEDKIKETPPHGFETPLKQLDFIEYRLAQILKHDKFDRLVGTKLHFSPKGDNMSFSIRRNQKNEITPFELNYRIQPTGKFVR